MKLMLVTLETFQEPNGWLNDEHPANIEIMLVTLLTYLNMLTGDIYGISNKAISTAVQDVW